MPPKNKKGKKGKRNSKSKKKIQLTPKEEILSYQIKIREEYLENLNFLSLNIQEDYNKVSKKLKITTEENEKLAVDMIQRYNSIVKINTNNKYDKSDVINCMKANWEIERGDKKEFNKLLDIMKMKDEMIRDLETEKAQLEWIKTEVIQDNDHQIKVLNQILDDMKGNFDAISSYLKKNHNEEKEHILRKEATSTNNFQQKACKKASKVINDDIKKEFADNKWLLTKRNVHKETFEKLKTEIEKIEEANIEMNKMIYELRQAHNGFPSLYLTEVEPDHILFQDGLLEYNVRDVFIKSDSTSASIPRKNNKTNNSLPSNYLPELWKDYLNLYPVNFDYLSVTGQSINILAQEPKSSEELENEKYTVHNLPVNMKSLDISE